LIEVFETIAEQLCCLTIPFQNKLYKTLSLMDSYVVSMLSYYCCAATVVLTIGSMHITCRSWFKGNWWSQQQCVLWLVAWLQFLLIPVQSLKCLALHCQLKMPIIRLA